MRSKLMRSKARGFSLLEAFIGMAIITFSATGLFGGFGKVIDQFASLQSKQDSNAIVQYLATHLDCETTMRKNKLSCDSRKSVPISLFTKDERALSLKNQTVVVGHDEISTQYDHGEIKIYKHSKGKKVDITNSQPLFCRASRPKESETYTNLYAYTMNLGNYGGAPSREILPGKIRGGAKLTLTSATGTSIHRVYKGKPTQVKACPQNWVVTFVDKSRRALPQGTFWLSNLPEEIPMNASRAYIGFVDAGGAYFDNEPRRRPQYGSTNGCRMSFEILYNQSC